MLLQNITSYRGECAIFTIALTRDAAAFTPGDEWILTFTAKRNKKDADGAAIFQKTTGAGITHSGTNALVAPVVEDTLNAPVANLFWDIWAKNINDGTWIPVAEGRWPLRKPVNGSQEPSVPIRIVNPPINFGWPVLEMAVPPTSYSAGVLSVGGGGWFYGALTMPYRRMQNGRPYFASTVVDPSSYVAYSTSFTVGAHTGPGWQFFGGGFYFYTFDDVASPELASDWLPYDEDTMFGTPTLTRAGAVAGTESAGLGQMAIATVSHNTCSFRCTCLDPIIWEGGTSGLLYDEAPEYGIPRWKMLRFTGTGLDRTTGFSDL